MPHMHVFSVRHTRMMFFSRGNSEKKRVPVGNLEPRWDNVPVAHLEHLRVAVSPADQNQREDGAALRARLSLALCMRFKPETPS